MTDLGDLVMQTILLCIVPFNEKNCVLHIYAKNIDADHLHCNCAAN